MEDHHQADAARQKERLSEDEGEQLELQMTVSFIPPNRLDFQLDSNRSIETRTPETKILSRDPQNYFSRFYEDLALGSMDRLIDRGSGLADQILPTGLGLELWRCARKARASGRVPSLLVQSDAPWIPWELLHLEGREDEAWVDGMFLAEAFELCRWENSRTACEHFPLRRIALVPPSTRDLHAGQVEVERLVALLGDRVELIEPTRAAISDRMARGTHDGWHFIGHGFAEGTDPNQWVLVLEDGELTPDSLRGASRNLGKTHPLIFLNACETSQGALALVGPGGWAPKILSLGAGAFIGTSFAVEDAAASRFAEVFYQELLAGSTLGECAWRARAALRQAGDVSWLAYCVWGHPTGRSASERAEPIDAWIDGESTAVTRLSRPSALSHLDSVPRKTPHPQGVEQPLTITGLFSIRWTLLALGTGLLLVSFLTLTRLPTFVVAEVMASRAELRLAGDQPQSIAGVGLPLRDFMLTSFGRVVIPGWIGTLEGSGGVEHPGNKLPRPLILTALGDDARFVLDPSDPRQPRVGTLDRFWAGAGTRVVLTSARGEAGAVELTLVATPSKELYIALSEDDLQLRASSTEIALGSERIEGGDVVLKGRTAASDLLISVTPARDELLLHLATDVSICGARLPSSDLSIESLRWVEQGQRGGLRSTLVSGYLDLGGGARRVVLRQGDGLRLRGDPRLRLADFGCDAESGHAILRLQGWGGEVSWRRGESWSDLRDRPIDRVFPDHQVLGAMLLFCVSSLLAFLAGSILERRWRRAPHTL